MSESYWARESTAVGRMVNDVIDAGRRLLGRTSPRQEFEESLLVQKDQLRSEARDIGLPVHEIQPVFHTGTWTTQDGDLQTSLFIGKSDDGYHYAVEGYQAGDIASTSPGWSRPLKTYDEARELGQEAQLAWEDQRAIVLDSVADLNKEGHLQALGPMPRTGQRPASPSTTTRSSRPIP